MTKQAYEDIWFKRSENAKIEHGLWDFKDIDYKNREIFNELGETIATGKDIYAWSWNEVTNIETFHPIQRTC